jgi:hypothetical protein
MVTRDPHLPAGQSIGAVARARPSRPSAGLTPLLAAAIIALAVLSQNAVLMVGATAFAVLVVRYAHLAPAYSFVVFYCVLYISVGAAFFGRVGHFPGDTASNAHVFLAVYILFAGYAAMFAGYLMAVGARSRTLLLPAQFSVVKRDHLAILCVVIFTPEWLGVSVSGSGDISGWAQIIKHLMDFRLVVLAYYILRSLDLDDMRSVAQIVLVTAYVGLPMSTTGGSGWSSMIVLCTLLASYVFIMQRRSALNYLAKRPGVTAAGVLIVGAVIGMALLWEGGLKGEWRQAIRAGEAGQETTAQLGNLLSRAQASAGNTDYAMATEALSGRMSSGVGYFSLVLSNLEQGMPHTSGALTSRALQNVPPRILFPNKGVLGSDSELVEQYAGIHVAGAEQGTSIGLGFIPELYIDFGLAGALIGCLVLGAMLGASHRILRWAAGNDAAGDLGFLVLVFAHALVYDASLAKFGAGIIHKTIVFAALLLALRAVFPARPQRQLTRP